MSHQPATESLASASGVVLDVSGVSKHFRTASTRVDAVADVSLQVRQGTTTALVGRSGSGKSTLLYLLGLITRPDTGTIRLCDQNTVGLTSAASTELRRRRLGFVFQDNNLLPQFSALRNVLLPWAGRTQPGLARARALLEAVGMGSRLEHRPSELSAGEQQRVAFARAQINHPALILADEPTGNLDSATESLLLAEFSALAAAGVAVVIATHSEAVSETAGARYRMQDGQLSPVQVSS